MKPLSVREVGELLRQSPRTGNAILVGGQALNVWAVGLGLAAESAALSNDIDFFGSRAQALQAGLDWRATVHTPGPDDATPNSAIVVVNLDREEHGIDFMNSIAGVDSDELRRWARTVRGTDYTFRVMHPLHVLQSQLENVYGTLKRRDSVGGEYFVGRVRLAVQVVAAAISQMLNDRRVRESLNAAKRVAELAVKMPALAAWQRDAIDVLAAIPRHGEWPEQFSEKRLPQLRGQVELKRTKYAARRASVRRS